MTALPTRKVEAWRYTDLKSLAAVRFSAAVRGPAPDDLPALDMPRVVFVNGFQDAAVSTPFAYLGAYAAVAEDSALPLAAINAQRATEGLTVDVPEGVDAGALLLVSWTGTQSPCDIHLRHRITLRAGAKLTVIEVMGGDGVYWHNPVTDIVLAEGAKLTHHRLQDEGKEAFHLATIRADIAAGAAYDGFTAALGAQLSRAEFHVRLSGKKAHVQLNAAQLLGGRQHADFTTVVAHDSPDCGSRQTVKSVLSGHARGVFQGRIEVARCAQRTDGYQMNQALLLSPDAEIDIKPELEIFADDVKCSHGATIGALDPEQIFYLRSRGIPEAEAREMLIRAFLDDALAPVALGAGRALFDAAIDRKWVGQ